MNPPSQWAEFSCNSFSPSTMIQQQSSFGSGLTVNRTSNDQLWLEVAKRYHQIIEKDIKLRYPSQPVNPIKTFQTDCNIPTRVENTQFGNNHTLSPSSLPVVYQKEDYLNVPARQKENEPGTFPRIVDVFSLNPSLPAKYFQDNVTVRLTTDGLIAQPVGRRSLTKVAPKQSAIHGHSFARGAENLQEKRNLVNYDYKKFTQNDNFQINQRADILDYIDIEASQNVTTIGTLAEGNPHAIEMHGGCEFQDSTKGEQMCDRKAMIIVNKQDLSEQIHSDVKAQSKRRKRKRRAIFGLRRNKKRHLMDNTNTVKANNQHEPEDEPTRDSTKIEKSLQFECSSSLKKAASKSDDFSADEKGNSSEKQSQERIQNGSNQSKQDDEENANIANARQTELKGAGTIDSENLKDTFVSSLHGNNIRQSKILDLKAKLAKQEQELQNLRQRKDFEDVKEENCASHAKLVEDNLGKDSSALFKYETIFDFSRPIDVTFWAQNEENDDDFDIGKMEDLVDTFQKEIESFRILDTELYQTGRGTDYDHLQRMTYVVGGIDKRVFAGINNKIRLAPQDISSKEQFLSQLGLFRIQ